MMELEIGEWVGKLSFLDPLAETVQRQLGEWLRQGGPGARRLKDALNGTWLGHPLHPLLTDLPIGAWTGSTLLDLVGADQNAADILLGAGCALAAAAAAAGVADWEDSYGAERRIGAAHGLVNLAALGAMTSALLLRRAGLRRRARPFALGGYGLAGVAGYLGGDLVFRLGTQVNRNAFVEPPSGWQDAGPAAEVPDSGAVVRQLGEARVMLTRLDGEIVAVASVCPHAGGPLAEGPCAAGVVECPWHGSRFDLRTGRVLGGPATMKLPIYEVRTTSEGQVEVKSR